MRDVSYSAELATATLSFDAANEAKIERISVKQNKPDEIGFSWWKDGSDDAVINEDVFTPQFRFKLRNIL